MYTCVDRSSNSLGEITNVLKVGERCALQVADVATLST